MEKTKYKPKLLIFASGTKDGGGSGFEALVDAQKSGTLDAEIVGVVSPHQNGGVRKIADSAGIRCFYYGGTPWTITSHRWLMKKTGAEWVALAGWLKKMEGYDPRRIFSIHPARLSFGGQGMYGIRVHRAVIDAFQKGLIRDTAVSMHFVTEEYDKGPVFFEFPIAIYPTDTPETLEERVKKYEHLFQWAITNLVIHEKISWDGKNPDSLIVPEGYRLLPKK